MKFELLSNCERQFILRSFVENLRIDGRKCNEFRGVKIVLGRELGTCLATVGKTKVFSQVKCSLTEPSSNRGSMGSVDVHVRMSPMAAPMYEDGKLGTKGIEVMRVLEMLLKECGVIDLESLCLRSYKQVWTIRAEVHILDDAGSLIDCASIAVLTALTHFRRPDVNVLPDSVIVYGREQRTPIPLNIYHLPICVSFGVYENFKAAVLDANDREELCLMGTLIIAMNKRHEICALHQTGNLVLNTRLIFDCVQIATERARTVTELINSVIADDNVKRSNREEIIGFSCLISLDVLSSHESVPNELKAPAIEKRPIAIQDSNENVFVEGNFIQIGGEQMQDDSGLIKQVMDITLSEEASQAAPRTRGELDDVYDLLDSIEEDFADSKP